MCFGFSATFLDSRPKPGRERLRGGFPENERQSCNQRCLACRENEALAEAVPVLLDDELPKVASAAELLVPCAQAPLARGASWFARNGCVLMANLNDRDDPEVLAIVPLQSAAERILREILLARLMLVMVDIVLAGDPLGLEAAPRWSLPDGITPARLCRRVCQKRNTADAGEKNTSGMAYLECRSA